MINIFCDFDWELFIKILQVVLPALTTVVAALVVYKFTKRNMRHETQERLSRYRNEKLYEAGIGFWSLLAYTTPAENQHSILSWEKSSKGNEKTYYMHISNAREFVTKLNEVNYEKGHGLFLRLEPRELFYEYRSILFGFLLKEKNNTAEKIKIENPEMTGRMLQLHNDMVVRLMQEMKLENPML